MASQTQSLISIPGDIAKQRSRWNLIAALIRVLYVVLGLVGVLAPVVVATFAVAIQILYIRIISFCATAAVAVFVSFDIGTLATRWREAWKHLNAACIAYQLGLIDLSALYKAYSEGENLIGAMKADILAKPSMTEGQTRP